MMTRIGMRFAASAMLALGVSVVSPLRAQDAGLARPDLVIKENVAGLPRSEKVEISVMTATLKPGDKTPFHTHRHPVTVYVLEGTFTLEMEGRQTVILKGGQAMIEPHHVRMTGYNRSATDETKVVIFYVSEIGTPFLDPVR